MRRRPGGATPVRAPGGRHWKMALCSLSIGSSVAPESFTAAISSGPAITRDSLFASSRRLPARAAASVERSPAAPTIAAITQCTSGRLASSSSAPAPASMRVPGARLAEQRRAARRPRSRRRARRRRAKGEHLRGRALRRWCGRRWRRGGSAADGARAHRGCSRRPSRSSRAPRRRSRRHPEQRQSEEQHRGGGRDAVDTIHHSAVSGKHGAAVL